MSIKTYFMTEKKKFTTKPSPTYGRDWRNEMSLFGEGTLEEYIYDYIDEEKYTKKEILRALLTIASYINTPFEDDDRTMLKED
jgi:hypothetical protein